MAVTPPIEITIFASASRTSSTNGSEMTIPLQVTRDGRPMFKGIHLVLDITAAGGTTQTLDVKIQRKDETSGNFVDMRDAAFAQKTGTGTDDLVIYPSITATANRGVSDALSYRWRAVATIGGTSPDFTFSLGGTYLP